jgi:hypothetical protein
MPATLHCVNDWPPAYAGACAVCGNRGEGLHILLKHCVCWLLLLLLLLLLQVNPKELKLVERIGEQQLHA